RPVITTQPSATAAAEHANTDITPPVRSAIHRPRNGPNALRTPTHSTWTETYDRAARCGANASGPRLHPRLTSAIATPNAAYAATSSPPVRTNIIEMKTTASRPNDAADAGTTPKRSTTRPHASVVTICASGIAKPWAHVQPPYVSARSRSAYTTSIGELIMKPTP